MSSSLWNWLLFTLIQRDKVKWVCVTLNEGYLRPANSGSNNIQIFNQNITDQPSMKRPTFLGLSFYCFLWLQIYEAIAAIFWQSANFVLLLLWDCRSTKLSQLFSGTLPFMFWYFHLSPNNWHLTKLLPRQYGMCTLMGGELWRQSLMIIRTAIF